MNYRRVGSPLLDSLFAQGLAVAGPLDSGLWTNQAGALRNQDGSFSHILFNVGPGRQGTLLESIAVPELRYQAAELAGLLTAQLHDQARAEEDAASERASRTGSEHAALLSEACSPEVLVGYDLAS
jgi:hydroxyacylglutathione hydrolase